MRRRVFAIHLTIKSRCQDAFAEFGVGELADVFGELFVFALEECGQGGTEVGAAEPFAHVVFPALPHAAGLFIHPRLVDEQVGAFEEGDEDAENREAAFFLLLGKLDARAFSAEEVEVGVIEHELQELAVLVGEALEDFLLVVHALFALVDEVDDDRERQAHDSDDEAEKLEGLEEVAGHDGGRLRIR